MVEVTATELFFSDSSVYIKIDTCVEAGKQVIFPNLNFLMSKRQNVTRDTDHKNGTIY